jgi:ribosomal protein S18 acetylase RimI-like enzyme
VSSSRGPFRHARSSDLDRLVEIETACFAGDRLSRRSLARLIRRDTAEVLVGEERGAIAAYAIILFHARRPGARLYSIAVDPMFSGKGLGNAMLAAGEDSARARGATAMRLEVRQDNDTAQGLYSRAGYRQTGAKHGYYSDGATALTFEKVLG